MYSDFSWECIRRNSKYIQDWLKFSNKLYENSDNTYEIENLSKQWGLLSYVDPSVSSPKNVYWSEAVSSRSIRIKIYDEGSISAKKIISDVDNFQRTYFFCENGDVCVKIYNEIGYFQVFMKKEDFLKIDIHKYIYVSWCKKNTSSLLKFLSGRMLPSSSDVKKFELLKIFDLHSSGNTHKEIAKFIYGERITNSEWESDSWLRGRIRYKLKKSQELIDGGFYKFL